jgi:hypothetical protein
MPGKSVPVFVDRHLLKMCGRSLVLRRAGQFAGPCRRLIGFNGLRI